MWTVAALNKKFDDVLGTYNSLSDPNLKNYFRRQTVREHLFRTGFITPEGRIVSLAAHSAAQQERRRQLQSLLNHALDGRGIISSGQLLTSDRDDRKLQESLRGDLLKRAKENHGHLVGERRSLSRRTTTIKPRSGKSMSSGQRSRRSLTCAKIVRPSLGSKRPASNYGRRSAGSSGSSNGSSGIGARSSRDEKVCLVRKDENEDEKGKEKEKGTEKSKGKDDAIDRGKEKEKKEEKADEEEETADQTEDDEEKNGEKKNQEEEEDLSEVSSSSSTSSGDEDEEEEEDDDEQQDLLPKMTTKRQQKEEKQQKQLKAQLRTNVTMTLKYEGMNLLSSARRQVKVTQQVHSQACSSSVIFDKSVAPGDQLLIALRPFAAGQLNLALFTDNLRDARVSTCCEHRHAPGARLGQFSVVSTSSDWPSCHSATASTLTIKRRRLPMTMKSTTTRGSTASATRSKLAATTTTTTTTKRARGGDNRTESPSTQSSSSDEEEEGEEEEESLVVDSDQQQDSDLDVDSVIDDDDDSNSKKVSSPVLSEVSAESIGENDYEEELNEYKNEDNKQVEKNEEDIKVTEEDDSDSVSSDSEVVNVISSDDDVSQTDDRKKEVTEPHIVKETCKPNIEPPVAAKRVTGSKLHGQEEDEDEEFW